MGTPNDEVARLDMAAKELVFEESFSYLRVVFLVLSLFLVPWLFAHNALSDKPLLATVSSAGVAIAFPAWLAFATVILWVNWRYKLYVLPLSCFAVTFVSVLGGVTFCTTSSRIWCGIIFGIFGAALWKQAALFAAVNAPGWRKERSRALDCWRLLTASERDKEVIEFSTGYFTYRLISPGPYWAIVKLARGVVDYRFRELSAVNFMALPTGEMKVRIGNRTVRAINVSPPAFGLTEDSSLPKSA